MKTFKEFCEQAKYNPFPPYKPPNVVQRFINRIGKSVNNRIRDAQETGEMASAALFGITPLDRHFARKDLLFKLRGGNIKNPDNMPIIPAQDPKDRKSYSLRQFQYSRDEPPTINPPPKGLSPKRRELRNILPGGKLI